MYILRKLRAFRQLCSMETWLAGLLFLMILGLPAATSAYSSDGSDLAVFAADFGRTDCSCVLDIEIYDGSYLWNADFSCGGRIHQIETNGNPVTSYSTPGNGPEGTAFDGTCLWLLNI